METMNRDFNAYSIPKNTFKLNRLHSKIVRITGSAYREQKVQDKRDEESSTKICESVSALLWRNPTVVEADGLQFDLSALKRKKKSF
jgi:hypothetical protein